MVRACGARATSGWAAGVARCAGETVRAVRLVRVRGVGGTTRAADGRRSVGRCGWEASAGRRPAARSPERVGRREDEGARATGSARRARRREAVRAAARGARSRAGSAARKPGVGQDRRRGSPECARSGPRATRRRRRRAPGRPACNPEARPGGPRGGGRRGGQDLARAHPERDQLRAEWRRPRNPVGSDLIRKAARIRVPRSGDRGGGGGQVARRRPGIAPAGARERPESAADPRAESAAARPESTNRPPEDPAQGFLEVNPKSSRSRGPARAGGGPGIAAAGRARARPRVLGRLRRATRRANAKTRERRARAAEPGEKFFEPRFRPVKRTRALLPTCSILTRSGQRARR